MTSRLHARMTPPASTPSSTPSCRRKERLHRHPLLQAPKKGHKKEPPVKSGYKVKSMNQCKSPCPSVNDNQGVILCIVVQTVLVAA
nr:MAG TPA: hypothetical protein [Caudoviricetes sp.]